MLKTGGDEKKESKKSIFNTKNRGGCKEKIINLHIEPLIILHYAPATFSSR
jgi:hypothetical protein